MQEPYGSDNVFINGLNSGPVSCSTLWSQNPLHTLNQNHVPQVQCGSSRSLNLSSDAQRLNIYENFMQELETGCSSSTDRTEPSEGEEDQDEEDEEEDMDGDVEMGGGGGGEQQGAVRRAGWLSFKALITVNKDRKLELVARRKWRHCWVTLKGKEDAPWTPLASSSSDCWKEMNTCVPSGCTLLFYETYGRSSGGAEQELAPRCALLTDDSIVQAVPEHPRREHVFCLSNSHGDVYLFQVRAQTGGLSLNTPLLL